MNNNLKLAALAFTPLFIGNILGFIPLNPVISFILSIIFLGYWLWIGCISHKLVKSLPSSILIGNSFGILSIVILVVSGLFFKSYPAGILGVQPQMYFLAVIRLSSALMNLFLKVIDGTVMFAVSFLLMLFVYFIGYITGKKRQHAGN